MIKYYVYTVLKLIGSAFERNIFNLVLWIEEEKRGEESMWSVWSVVNG